MQGMKNNTGIAEIEEKRKLYLKDRSKVSGDDLGAGSRLSKSSGQRVSNIAAHGISSKKDCVFLSEWIKMIQPEIVIELGTSLGIATAYLAKANTQNYVHTFEGNNSLARKAQKLFDQLKCENVDILHGDIDEMLPRKLAQLDKIDFALIDANHTYDAALNYFDLLQEKISDTGVMIIDDIRWSPAMNRAWNNLVARETVSISIEFLNQGVLMFEKHLQKQHYILSY
jgi:predicted O-methyltransferase YrrM